MRVVKVRRLDQKSLNFGVLRTFVGKRLQRLHRDIREARFIHVSHSRGLGRAESCFNPETSIRAISAGAVTEERLKYN